MMHNPESISTSTIPSAESQLAKTSLALLERVIDSEPNETVELRIRSGDGTEVTAILPGLVIQSLTEILRQTVNGNSVSILPMDLELTVNQAAKMLEISQSQIVLACERAELPYRKAEELLLIRIADLLRYRQHLRSKRLEALRLLTEQAEELDLGYGT